MQWLQEPENWQEENNTVTVQSKGKTDFWRITRHGYITDNAHLYYKEVTGDFTATVKFTGDYTALYDQAGLMVRESETVWMKCGVEYLDGVQQASAVITRDFSDWSIVPLANNPRSIWIMAQRIKETIEVSYSLDGEQYTMIRQGYLSTANSLQVGMMCAAPIGDGFKVIFENFTITQEQ